MRTARTVLAVAACVALAAGCTTASEESRDEPSDQASPQQTGPISVKITPGDGTREVAPNKPVRVAVTGGEVVSVKVKGKGKVTGKVSSDGTSWQSTGTLHPAAAYRVVVEAKNDAKDKSTTAKFTTKSVANGVKAAIAPLDGSVVGVGQPIAVYLSQSVRNRAAVERALEVRTDEQIEGSWNWFADDELHFRPKEYWPARTKVALHADLAGVKAGPGLWGVEDRTIKFTIGRKQTSLVNAKKHTMTVKVGDKVVRRLPVSTGNAKYPTKSGVHVVMGKADPYEMDSTTAGITGSDAYLTTVRYAVRISNSGEFVHAAPWSASSQGRRNVSHGCVNVTTARAQWFYNFSQVGDIVDVVGTDVRIEPTNGFGDWNVPWRKWRSGSALD